MGYWEAMNSRPYSPRTMLHPNYTDCKFKEPVIIIKQRNLILNEVSGLRGERRRNGGMSDRARKRRRRRSPRLAAPTTVLRVQHSLYPMIPGGGWGGAGRHVYVDDELMVLHVIVCTPIHRLPWTWL